MLHKLPVSITKIFTISLVFVFAIILSSDVMAVSSTPKHECGTIAGTCTYQGIQYKRATVTDIDSVKWNCGFGSTIGPNPTAKECKIKIAKVTVPQVDVKVKDKVTVPKTPTVVVPKTPTVPPTINEKKDALTEDDVFSGYVYVDDRIKHNSFSGGDILFFNYTIHNTTKTNVIVSYIPYIDCPLAPNSPMTGKQVTIMAGASFSDSFKGIMIDDSTDAQVCTASVMIGNVVDQQAQYVPFSNEEVVTELKIDMPESFDFEVNASKNGTRTRTFYLNDKISINYSSSIKPKIKAFLTNPQGSKSEIKIPFSFVATTVGNYVLEATAYSQGYKPSTTEFTIGVITTKPAVLGYKTEADNQAGASTQVTNNTQVSTNNNLSPSLVDNEIIITNKDFWGKVRGKFIIRAEHNGETYRVSPTEMKMYYLADADATYALMSSGTGITNNDLAKLEKAFIKQANLVDSDNDTLPDSFEKAIGSNPNNVDTDGDGHNDGDEFNAKFNINGLGAMKYDDDFAKKNSGKLFLQVDDGSGRSWYVNSKDQKAYYMSTKEEAFLIMKWLALGVPESFYYDLVN